MRSFDHGSLKHALILEPHGTALRPGQAAKPGQSPTAPGAAATYEAMAKNPDTAMAPALTPKARKLAARRLLCLTAT